MAKNVQNNGLADTFLLTEQVVSKCQWMSNDDQLAAYKIIKLITKYKSGELDNIEDIAHSLAYRLSALVLGHTFDVWSSLENLSPDEVKEVFEFVKKYEGEIDFTITDGKLVPSFVFTCACCGEAEVLTIDDILNR